ncbi:MAG: hypothetical protein Q9218_007670 [Villophora microphyllina]
MFLHTSFLSAGLASALLLSNVYAQQPDASGITWFNLTDPSLLLTQQPVSRIPSPEISAFGISYDSHSSEHVTDYNFLITALQTMENIYDTSPNFSQAITNYAWVTYDPTVSLNISAVGRGLEEGLPITFTNGAMVLFLRWLAQISHEQGTWRWVEFSCFFYWQQGPERQVQNFLVAEGNFTAFRGYNAVPGDVATA